MWRIYGDNSGKQKARTTGPKSADAHGTRVCVRAYVCVQLLSPLGALVAFLVVLWAV